MKLWLRFLLASSLIGLVANVTLAQQQPVLSVNITSPANETAGPSGTGNPVLITALATGSLPAGGFVYTFYVNGTPIGTSTNNVNLPAVSGILSWTPPAPGAYFFTVTANDGVSPVVTSLPVRYFATGAVINSPSNPTIVPASSSVVIKADATPAQGFIQKLDFYDGATLIGTDSTYPYSLIYAPSGSSGSHPITVQATTSTGAVLTSASISLQMTSGVGTPPSSVVTSPANNVAIAIPNYIADATASIPINVNANAPAGTIAKVETYIDGILANSDTTFPYTYAWRPAVIGRFTITALAFDDKNNVVASTPVVVPVSAPPSVAISSPASNASLAAGTPFPLTANASDSDGSITSVQFFADGKIVGTATTSPYTISYVPVLKPDLTATALTAVATDNLGLTTTSSIVSVTVSNGNGGGGVVIGQAPTVSVTGPVAGTQLPVGAPVTVTANASDSDGNVFSVQFFVNNTSIGTDLSYPYSVTWTPSSLGTYTLTAKATDNDGNPVTSSSVSVSVVDFSAGLPSVAITSPVSGSSLTVGATRTIAATATDDGSITGVQFYINGQPLGGSDTTFPYTATWTPTSIGSYTLIARATDNGGNQSASAPVTVQITAGASPAVSLTSPSTALTVALGTAVNLSANASDSDGTVESVKFIANNTILSTDITAPYTTSFVPTAAGVYSVIAQAQDNIGNTTDSTPVVITVLDGSTVPIVILENPGSDTSISADSSLLLAASADVASGSISRVEFYAGPTLLTTVAAAPYTYVWRPAGIGTYAIRAVAYGPSGQGISSSVSTVKVTPAVAAPGARYVTLTNPVNGLTIVAFRNIAFTAVTNIPSSNPEIDFYFNGLLFQTVTSSPYQTTRNPSTPGRYEFYAVMRVGGSTYTSAPVYVTVLPNQPPSIAITSPSTGSTVTVGAGVTIKATATDPDDAVDTVQFLINGQPFSTASSFPYTASWQPTSEGVYTISAIVKDSQGSVAGNQVTSAPIYVRAVAPAGSAGGGGGTAPDSSYSGTYFSLSESGKFAVMNVGGKAAVFIGYSTTGAKKTYFYSGLPVDSGGGFLKTDSSGRVLLSGVTSESGVSGEIDNARLTFIAPITFPSGSTTVPSGYYTGNLSGKLDSTLSAIVGLDGSIMIFAANGSFTDAASGRLNSNGTFSLTTAGGNLLTGKVDAATGLFTGTLAGSSGGAFTGALASGGSFSDGALRNLSTRGQVGTGANVLIAGFVVGGTSPKQVLIRAVGPSLAQFNITGALADPQLSIFQGGTTIASNDNWAGSAPLVLASAQAGAFALDATSKDAVVLTTLSPGAYTAQVSGVGGTTGVALIELYDRDAASAFSPQKVMNVSTRGVVSSGQGALIAGFVVSGTVPKKVLIRAIGPGLAAFNVSGALADPVLRVIRNDNVVVRENDNWEVGNDSALLADVSSKTGAFALAAGSKDAALLFSLPPGTYTAQVSGANNTGGVALVEVYEVP